MWEGSAGKAYPNAQTDWRTTESWAETEKTEGQYRGVLSCLHRGAAGGGGAGKPRAVEKVEVVNPEAALLSSANHFPHFVRRRCDESRGRGCAHARAHLFFSEFAWFGQSSDVQFYSSQSTSLQLYSGVKRLSAF